MEPIFVTIEWTLCLANLFRIFVRLMHVLTFSFSCKICRCKAIGIYLRSAAPLSLSFMMFYNDDDERVRENRKKNKKEIDSVGCSFPSPFIIVLMASAFDPSNVTVHFQYSIYIPNVGSFFFRHHIVNLFLSNLNLKSCRRTWFIIIPMSMKEFSNDANAKKSHNSFSDQCQSEESKWYVLAI